MIVFLFCVKFKSLWALSPSQDTSPACGDGRRSVDETFPLSSLRGGSGLRRDGSGRVLVGEEKGTRSPIVCMSYLLGTNAADRSGNGVSITCRRTHAATGEAQEVPGVIIVRSRRPVVPVRIPIRETAVTPCTGRRKEIAGSIDGTVGRHGEVAAVQRYRPAAWAVRPISARGVFPIITDIGCPGDGRGHTDELVILQRRGQAPISFNYLDSILM